MNAIERPLVTALLKCHETDRRLTSLADASGLDCAQQRSQGALALVVVSASSWTGDSRPDDTSAQIRSLISIAKTEKTHYLNEILTLSS